jgi:plasmid stabilization system protein ParE
MRQIVITPRAQKEFNSLFEYLELKWSLKVKNDFVMKLNLVLKSVDKNPESFPISSKNNKFRKCVITKQNTLFYHYNEKHIVVVAVFDTRQNPKKLKI